MTVQTKQEELLDKIGSINAGHHECDDGGYGCKYEEFKSPWTDSISLRCTLKREYEEELLELINSEVLSVLEELGDSVIEVIFPQNDWDNGFNFAKDEFDGTIQSIKNRYKL